MSGSRLQFSLRLRMLHLDWNAAAESISGLRKNYLTMNIEIPERVAFLYKPAEIKVLFGGRGKGATWGIADALLTLGIKRPLRWLCTRETMTSIAESTHTTLRARIAALGYQSEYRVEERRIICTRWNPKPGQESTDPLAGRYGFSFAGLHNNVDGIKSYEQFDGCWLAEAQGLTKRSWEMLEPTFRKDAPLGPFGAEGMGSEMWVDFNPDLDTDFAWQNFVVKPSSRAVVHKLSWRDNPFFPEKLRRHMEELRREDPDSCDWIYEGIPRSNVKGAIFGDEMRRMDLEGRIGPVPYDPVQPIHTFWDVGLDTTAIWFVQCVGMQLRLVDYYENKGKGMDHYVRILQQRGYIYARHWLPWDVGVQAAPEGMGQGKSLESIMRQMMPNVEIRTSPRWNNTQTAINAARLLFPRVWIDASKCEDGILGLRRYQWGDPPKSGATTRQPLHDRASHPSAAFQYISNFSGVPVIEREYEAPRSRGFNQYSPFG